MVKGLAEWVNRSAGRGRFRISELKTSFLTKENQKVFEALPADTLPEVRILASTQPCARPMRDTVRQFAFFE